VEDVGIFYVLLVYLLTIWYILWQFWSIFHVLVCCTEKNADTISRQRIHILRNDKLSTTLQLCIEFANYFALLVNRYNTFAKKIVIDNTY
jgi:hypothetical protein